MVSLARRLEAEGLAGRARLVLMVRGAGPAGRVLDRGWRPRVHAGPRMRVYVGTRPLTMHCAGACRQWWQVHDELVLEVEAPFLRRVAVLLQQARLGALGLGP